MQAICNALFTSHSSSINNCSVVDRLLLETCGYLDLTPDSDEANVRSPRCHQLLLTLPLGVRSQLSQPVAQWYSLPLREIDSFHVCCYYQ